MPESRNSLSHGRGTHTLVAILILWMAAGCNAFGQSERPVRQGNQKLPDTPEGAWLESFLESYNTGRREVVQRFADLHGGDSGYYYALYRELGPLSYRAQDGGAFWLNGDITKAWAGFVVRPQADGPGYTLAGVRRGIRPQNAPLPDAIEPDELAAYLDNYLRLSSREDHFSGVVLVARNGRVLFEGAYGLSNRNDRVQNTVDTQFNLASVSKVFVGVAIARLAEQGKLALEDPLSKFIPEYPPHIGDKVTVHHLLTHTSGIELDDYGPFNEAVARAESLDDVLAAHVQFIENLNLGNYDDFDPLTSFDYTNEGVDLLGIVIERASGQDWIEYLQEHVFAPAGMTATGWSDGASRVVRRAKGYSLRNEALNGFVTGPRREVDAGDGSRAFQSRAARPAGSGYSTVGDLFRFARALTEHTLLTPPSLKRVTSPHVEMMSIGPMQRSYGYLFDIVRYGDLLTVGHTGGAPGTNTEFLLYPDLGYVVIVLSNFDRSAALHVSEHIKELITASEDY